MSLKPALNAKDHIQGSEHAAIELVEYGDYQCPHCGRAYPLIKNIQAKLGKDLKFIFRNFPLADAHPNAMHAAIAAEAAGRQGKFWEMHDIIFEHQIHLGDSHLVKYAAGVGADVDQFKIDFEKPEITQRVEADFESGIRSGVNGTPGFFINGQKFNGDWEGEEFLEHLKGML